ncbi:hypothetical protein Q0M94_12185 [Deinococcus radiomollis]|uniref:hypothetical protein n=1 Tax=Deinococcus radiomollis TaxID=468916 RepID=UPI003891DFF1
MTDMPRPWDVYFFYTETTTPPKEKFVIITHVPPGVQYAYGIFINSELNPFQQKPELSRCFVDVPVAEHAFLDYDSFAACGDVYTFPFSQLIPANFQGRISDQTAREIRYGAIACPILKGGHKKIFQAMVTP